MKKEKNRGYSKLKGYFVEKDISQQEVAELLGINRSTLNSKLNRNKADFTMEEARLIASKYNLDMNKFFWFKCSFIGTI